MLSRVSPLKRLTPGLNRDCRMLIGLPTSDFSYLHPDPGDKTIIQHGPIRPQSRLHVPQYIRLVLSVRLCPLYLPPPPPPYVPCPPPPMHETRRLVEAASALSALLQTRGVPHAFYGDILISLLANQPLAAVRSFVAERRTFLIVCLPSKFRASCKAGLHIRSASSVMPSAPRKISQPPRPLGLTGSKPLLPCFSLHTHNHSSLQVTRKMPPIHSPNRSMSGNAYSPACMHSHCGLIT